MSVKTVYTDPTIAIDPPGGKHHVIREGGRKMSPARSSRKAAKRRPSSAKKISKTKR